MSDATAPYDSFLLVSFGGPEGPDEVIPFLENVLRGKNVPRERMMEVAEHYQSFGGVSPINQQNRELIEAIRGEFDRSGIELPIYWGNRNWHPTLPETLRQMRDDGRRRALAFFTNMFSSYSGCRQYRENIAAAQEEVGEGAPVVEKVRFGFNHPGFIEASRERVRTALAELEGVSPEQVTILFTAHSIPMAMAANCDYEMQLRESCRLVADGVEAGPWRLVFQSRSGPPQQPWLEPDVCDAIRQGHAEGQLKALVIVPIGFVSDHMEVLYDLDEEAATLCRELGLPMRRAGAVGTHPEFVRMIGSLVLERLDPTGQRPALGELPAWHDVCPTNCCLYTPQRPSR
ncbi:ferrochelatase [Candidatus Laterigemmans baculatus]|uniref:ferrochelatase n=1 Tax=Candidatus Laterigemmans baculatus TaxID=2770505 RepID=UPI0013DB176D|nr:ferrochelatase [Candidatus Laterigemmans baculatus]